MPIPTLAKWFGTTPSAPSGADRSQLRVGIPRTLNVWSTHQFWIGFFTALGFDPKRIVFSSDTSEEQYRNFGRGRGTVDCCYPVKCMAGHYGELIFRDKRPLDILFSPMVYSLPSYLHGHVTDNLACPRVMAAPENIKAGFLKEKDIFAERNIRYVAPLVNLAEPPLVPKQLYDALKDVLPGLTPRETQRAAEAGYRTLGDFTQRMRNRSRAILGACAQSDKPCILVVARPYHMDPGLGHEIETELQGYGYPILWTQYLPVDDPLMDWMFGEQIRAGAIRSAFDLTDVWPSSYSANTNEILWGAKFAARMPWITCVVRLTSYECGMDQPTFTPVQQIVERSSTLFFSFQELDATKPAGSIKIRVETIAYYLERSSRDIIARKKAASASSQCPLLEEQTQPACPT